MTSIPHFGAVYIAPQDVGKLSQSRELGFPRTAFTQPGKYSAPAHHRFNATVAGALRSSTNDPELHVGSDFAEDRVNNGHAGAILATRADAMPETDPLQVQRYDKDHTDELALTQALRASRIPYVKGSYTELYNKTRLDKGPN
jgi:hypothetical protein